MSGQYARLYDRCAIIHGHGDITDTETSRTCLEVGRSFFKKNMSDIVIKYFGHILCHVQREDVANNEKGR